MILVTVKKDAYIKRLTIEGHSGYKKIGSDIVCSAVSTAATVSFNLIDKVCSKYSFNSDPSIPLIDLQIEEESELVEMILTNLLETLEGISLEYPKNLKIKNE